MEDVSPRDFILVWPRPEAGICVLQFPNIVGLLFLGEFMQIVGIHAK